MNFRLILLPFSWIYSFIVGLRRFFYKKGWLKSYSFSLPTICVGNLRVGGTGKTPHIEYLVAYLKDDYKIAVLSRGYGRRSKGYVLANELPDHLKNAEMIGDEPLQFHLKNPDIPVAVCEKRRIGIENLIAQFPDLDCILLDDAFQHLAVNYSLKILLTEYHKPYAKDHPFPAGNLRESRNAAKNADVVIVTKTPNPIDPNLLFKKRNQLHLNKNQELFFTSIFYKPFIPLTESARLINMECIDELFVVTGIANPKPLLTHLEQNYSKIHCFSYPDHYIFTPNDLQNIKNNFELDPGKNAIILTTEKDWMRLSGIQENCLLLLPVFSIPIETRFLEQEDTFLNIIEKYVRKN
ncbi:MAG TPA: tetraacyldisaccharide 4'-kinase [Bacteroidales bacterium]|nr:tetraacyldisaccharide 4'-kinase [Bacteroidales bacterium]